MGTYPHQRSWPHCLSFSRQHENLAGHTLQPVSVFSAVTGLGLADAEDTPNPFMHGCCPVYDLLRPQAQPLYCSIDGSVYYEPRRQPERGFPGPLIEPRRCRPHSINIVSYPSGFVPHELRPPRPCNDTTTRHEKRRDRKRKREEAKARKREERVRRREEARRSEKQEKRRSLRSLSSLPPGTEKVGRAIDKIFAAFSITPKPAPTVSATPTRTPRTESRPSSFISFARRLSRLESTPLEPVVAEEPAAEPPISMTGVAVPRPRAASTGVTSTSRANMMSIRSAKTMISSSVSEVQKPVASGSGVTCSILLAEPNVFLTGFEHDGQTRRGAQTTSALLRGKLQLNVSKNVKIKSITLKLVGKARTNWPEGIPPAKAELFEEQTLRTQSLVFFQAMHQEMWDTEYGSQCSYVHKSSGLMGALQPTASSGALPVIGKGRNSTLTAKEYKKLSLQSVNSRSFGKGDSPHINPVQAKGYKVFRPGTYEYSFELPLDHSQLETAKLPYGSVRWDLEAAVERAGAFKPNLHGAKEVSVVRLPDQMSLETVEPISISRHWEDQLHYDIIISGKSFPIGGRIPIAFKLTPLAKVQVHKLKVYATESIEYWTNNRHVTRKDAGRKILLLEKAAGKPLDKQYSESDIRVVSGGELAPDQRADARRTAARRRVREASRNRGVVEPLPEPSDNLLGDLDLGLESFWGSTEIEMNVQLPTCEMMTRDKMLRLHPDCSWKNVNVFHWIKLVMRISRADPDDPTGKKRRHFEISIDSPFTVLDCRATQANTALPRYSGSDRPIPEQRQQMSCGCPDAHPLDPSSAPLSRPLTMVEEDTINLNGHRLRLNCPLPNLPQAAHLQAAAVAAAGANGRQSGSTGARPETSRTPVDRERPIHLIRHPSHNPPAFDADQPPPALPLQTPPPHYDIIVGTPSVDGLADYFARLAAYEKDDNGENDGDGDADSTGLGITPPASGGGAAVTATGETAQTQTQAQEVVPRGADSDDSDTNTIGPDTETTEPTPASDPPSVGAATVADAYGAEVDPFSTLRFPEAGGEVGAGAGTGAGVGVGVAGGSGDNEADSVEEEEEEDDEEDEEEEDGRARLHRGGRVNVANPRTPGGRLVPSRSLEIERPMVRLDMTGVLMRRGGQ
ncbi:uncharacterized protein B0H64DRAFT_171886 [Chaetomium fimeti]|uniref:Arrestin C-terminal-like domain-containing protein n=1 Tax=Chaetomium fimeti TaxID=1854472 RepID=A0AAE0HH98_9PEZI|nr:hypothetical protein B0H64DRAFT_171886 [Chaetomium fimeti]